MNRVWYNQDIIWLTSFNKLNKCIKFTYNASQIFINPHHYRTNHRWHASPLIKSQGKHRYLKSLSKVTRPKTNLKQKTQTGNLGLSQTLKKTRRSQNWPILWQSTFQQTQKLKTIVQSILCCRVPRLWV